jgi:hypothetical protein
MLRICVALVLGMAIARLDAGEAPISKETALEAIILFRNQPFGPEGHAAAAIIFRFVESSPDIQVNISRKVDPILRKDASKLTEEQRGILLAGFLAGNADAQLLRSRAEDQPLAGVEQLIATYRQMQQRTRNLPVPEIEKLIELQNSSRLKAYLSSR